MTLRIGALFAGYGGLDQAVESVLDAEVAWVSEFDAHPSRILAHRYPHAPNLGDVTKIDWSAVEPVDIITGGYPCQPFSAAGNRLGVDDPRHLWPHVVEAISTLRPRVCIFENVQGHLSLGLDHVIRDLDLLGYDASWHLLSAASVGAPHRRNRIFILAWERNERHVCRRPDRRRGVYRNSGVGRLVPGPAQGHDDRQGDGGAAPDGTLAWREDRRPASRHGAQPGLVQLAAHGGESVRTDRDAATAPAGEGRSGGHRPGVPSDGGRRAETAERPGDLDQRDAREGGSVHAPDTGRESARTGCACPGLAEWFAGGGSPLGGLVGAGGGSVRAGRVHGQAPAERADGGGPHLPGDLTLLPTPAVNDMGASYTPETWDEWTDRMRSAHGNGNGHGKSLHIEALRLLPTPVSSDSNGPGVHGEGGADLRTTVALLPTPMAQDSSGAMEDRRAVSGHGAALRDLPHLLPTPSVADVEGGRKSRSGVRSGELLLNGIAAEQRWGEYAPAIARWEALNRPAPDPTEPTGKNGAHRLSPRFVEWLMGLPAGWVTDAAIWEGVKPSTARNAQLKALGNGVVPQQAAAALRWLLDVRASALTDKDTP